MKQIPDLWHNKIIEDARKGSPSTTTFKEKKCATIFAASDSAGETAPELTAASVAQYPTVDFILIKRTSIKGEGELVQALGDAKKAEAMILYTIINDYLVTTTNQLFNEHQLFHFDILTSSAAEIERLAGVAPTQEPDALHHLNENYFKRIEAMESAVKYDDDKDPRGFLEADMLLLGVSRTSKTPLSLFLANKNLKVTSLPLIPEAHLPEQLFETDPKKTVGLTNDPSVLNGIHKKRTRAYGLPESTSCSDIKKIRRELALANDLYQKLGCIVTGVASLSIEETASMILNALNLENHSYRSAGTSED